MSTERKDIPVKVEVAVEPLAIDPENHRRYHEFPCEYKVRRKRERSLLERHLAGRVVHKGVQFNRAQRRKMEKSGVIIKHAGTPYVKENKDNG